MDRKLSARPALGECARRFIRSVAEPANHGLDLPLRLLAYRASVDHARHGHGRHARNLGNVRERRRCARRTSASSQLRCAHDGTVCCHHTSPAALQHRTPLHCTMQTMRVKSWRIAKWSVLTRSGAQERTRTSTPLRAPAPEAGASTNSATWAQELDTAGRRRRLGERGGGCQRPRATRPPCPAAGTALRRTE